MATYTYSDWASQATNQLRYARLNLFIGEVQEKVDNERSADNYSRGSNSPVALLALLMKERTRLESMPGVSASGSTNTSPFSPARLVGRRNIY